MMVYQAYAVNISGVVKNSEGVGVAGVAVKLGKADIKTTTGSDGSFTLTDVTGLKHPPHHNIPGTDRLLTLEGNRLFFSAAKRTKIKVAAFGCNGRLLLSFAKVVSEGNGSMAFPQLGSGVKIFRVSIDDRPYIFSIVTTSGSNCDQTLSCKAIGRAKQAKASAQFDDALLFIREGYQLSRIAVSKPDTSGLEVTMTPLDTGTVKDYEGNVYKTVRIGNQYWTAENLRSTKYTDGSSIGSSCLFYNNSTDAAAKKKWGALYNDAAVKSGKLAPTGWRIPTNADWDTMQKYLISQGYNYDGTTKEDKIAKAIAATTDWDTTSEAGAIGNDLSLNNASGFSALPAGWRFWDNNFEKQYSGAYWWIAGGGSANVLDVWWNSMALDRYSTIFIFCSIRLVRNA